LERDVNIVSIFGGSERAVVEFVKGALLPVGMFRERRQRALARASLVVVSHRSVVWSGQPAPSVDTRIMRLLPQHLSVYSSYLEPVGISPLEGGPIGELKQAVACTAIANPEGFLVSLKRLGIDVVGTEFFPDHHEFTEGELLQLLRKYPTHSFVCTAKDAVKISKLTPEITKRFCVLNVRATVVPSGEFFAHIERLLGSISLQKSDHTDD
jgi:tetraacyldisaccharide 4'-kinase